MKFTLASVLSVVAAASFVSAAPTPAQEDSSANLSKRAYSGTATWYTQNGNPGACGSYHSDSDYIVALQTSMYDGGAHCGKMIKVTNENTGASTTLKVADECPSCESSQSIDLSTAAFEALGSKDQGVLPVSWYYI